jgi:hypothetical protein
LFRRNLPDFFWASVEAYTEPGIPDSYYCKDGVGGWIEFKKVDANKISSLTPIQVSWHAAHSRKGGRSFFFVRKGRELWAFKGGQGGLLHAEGLKGCPPLWVARQPWDWTRIRSILLASQQ